MIPGLENATFERYGQMHRNAFIASPKLLDASLAFVSQPGLFVAGQLAGVEGYAGNIASGWVAGINAARFIQSRPMVNLPITTMTGAIMHYITHAELKDFQPMKAMFGLLPKPDDGERRSKRQRYDYYSERAMSDLENYLKSDPIN
jgi:methylenetetrahydrofolate--tRNA-(uracil-5-)-methyltransferase